MGLSKQQALVHLQLFNPVRFAIRRSLKQPMNKGISMLFTGASTFPTLTVFAKNSSSLHSIGLNMSRFDAPLRHGTASHPVRCAILISGSGTRMEAMLEHQQKRPDLRPHDSRRYISDKAEASGVLKARNRGIGSNDASHFQRHMKVTNVD